MKLTRKIKKITILSSILSTFLLLVIIGIFIFNTSYEKFNKESELIREEYYNKQKELIKYEVYRAYDYIQYYKDKTEKRLKKEMKNRVYEAHSMILNMYENNKDKSKEEIEKMIKDALKDVRFNEGQGYYFITRLDGTGIVYYPNGKPQNGNLLNVQDSEGRYVIKDMINIAKTSKEGFYEYTWTKPNKGENQYRKISFVKYFEPLDIYIGTGTYMNYMEKIVKKEVLDRVSKIRYGNDGYIFVTNYDGMALVFAQEEYLGKNVSHIRDVNGINIHNEQVKLINASGEGFVEYCWPKPNVKGIYPKITFVKGFDEWKWIFGSGAYVDEIENTIKMKKINLREEIKSNIIGITLIIFLIGGLIVSIQLYSLKRAEQAIIEEEKLYEILTNLSEDGIFILEPYGKIIESNHKGLEMISCSEQDVIKLNFKELMEEPLFKDSITKISKETYLKSKHNELIPVELHIKSIELNRKNKFIAYVRDLTKRRIYEETLKEMATIDELTEVYNRRFIINQLRLEIEKIKEIDSKVSLVLLDIDGFKRINDTYGHIFGDKILKILARTFKDNLREIDFIGRYGGEEFIVLLSNTDRIAALKIIERIKNICINLKWEYENVKTTFSAGIIEINSTNNNEDIMYYINEVDKLLYKAKKNGRNRIEII
ncbi:cache domain-containing protein [Anaeromicrobium sediminis]|uniref:GGDEF domain-containing protein n=1 Tax=Anaeromicrobium sediminis TaxID=1478221 RepID=A0A267ML96_9FIRM|nr:cache domain-containing protein [Anaeromicrobium sediminis]PAB59655.1 hypothetical protein CCE28_08800 [Anaeromicrobium sediminis]